MIKIALCDDNPVELEQVKNLLQEYANEKESFEIAVFDKPEKLLWALEDNKKFQIYLLDVVMPTIDGITVGDCIRRQDENSVIIFLTISREFALSAYRVFPLQYLVKPVEKGLLYRTLDYARKIVLREEDKEEALFPVKTPRGIRSISLKELCYAELASRTVAFHMSTEECIRSVYLRTSFDNYIAEILKLPYFMRPRKSFAVNMNYLVRVNQQEMEMTDGRILLFSRTYAQEAKTKYLDFMARLGGGSPQTR